MYDIGFFINYLFLPLALSSVYVFANIKKNNTTIMNFYLLKGIFSSYLVIVTLIEILKVNFSGRYAIGLALALGIMDSAISIVDGIKIGKSK